MLKSHRSFANSDPHASGGTRSHSGDTPHNRAGSPAGTAGDCRSLLVPCCRSALGARGGGSAR